MQAFEQLEIEFGKFIGNPNTVACSTGSSALHLSLEVLKKPGWSNRSRVIVPEFTMIACARAVVLADMQPVFVDCDERLLMQVDGLPTWNVRALMAVHIYGRQRNMPVFHKFAKENGIAVIEDCAEIHGVIPHPDTDAACWSFYQNKIICCPNGEGGMIAFKNPEHAIKAKQLRSLGFTDAHDYTHIPRGCNYRLSNVHAELILKSLADYPKNQYLRRMVEEWYNELMPIEYQMPARSSVWVYDIRIPGLTRERQDKLIRELNQRGIAVRHSFKSMSDQPEFLGDTIPVRDYPNASKASQEVIYFPVSPLFSREDVERNVSAFLTALET